jgi:hypothetical protein
MPVQAVGRQRLAQEYYTGVASGTIFSRRSGKPAVVPVPSDSIQPHMADGMPVGGGLIHQQHTATTLRGHPGSGNVFNHSYRRPVFATDYVGGQLSTGAGGTIPPRANAHIIKPRVYGGALVSKMKPSVAEDILGATGSRSRLGTLLEAGGRGGTPAGG